MAGKESSQFADEGFCFDFLDNRSGRIKVPMAVEEMKRTSNYQLSWRRVILNEELKNSKICFLGPNFELGGCLVSVLYTGRMTGSYRSELISSRGHGLRNQEPGNHCT